MSKAPVICLIIVGILVGLLLLAVLLTPNFVFHFLFDRPSRSKKIPKYYVGTPHYKVSRAGMAKMENMANEDHYIVSRDGLKLHGYLFPTEQESKKFVIGVHGYRSYARPECAPYVEFYHDLGFHMLMVDDRAHAPSEGDYIGFGVLDRLDVVDWCKYLVKTYGEDIEILLHGVSMGGATVLAASGEEDLPGQVIGITSDCGFSSPREILTYQLQEAAHLPGKLLMPRIQKLWERKIGGEMDAYAAINQVKKAKVPILFVQGMKDTMVPPCMVDELYEACASRKRVLKVAEAGHGESIAFEPDQYHQAIIEHFSLSQGEKMPVAKK